MKTKMIGIFFCVFFIIPMMSTIATSNQPPTAPDIEGSPNGKTGVQYMYGFCSTDPDGDNITICVDWGDMSDEVYIGPFSSGLCVTATHTWSKQGTYVIKAKASDGQAESDWSTLEVSMPTRTVDQSHEITTALEPSPYLRQSSRITQTNYTHTVFVEVGTATWCPSCPDSNAAWHRIYGTGNYDFEYTELVYDKNPAADSRFMQFNPMWVPTSYFDAGEYVYPGTDYETFYTYLNYSGSRVVPDLSARLEALSFEFNKIKIYYTIENTGVTSYPGTLKIYVVELESTHWEDFNHQPYHHAFLDFAENKTIQIPAAGSISDTITWDGDAAGYPDIDQDNIQIILAVFTDTPITSFSDPPTGSPFNAYYSDECVAVVPIVDNNPPGAPSIQGPANGKTKVQQNYTVKSVDPDGGDVYYYADWGDNSNSGWVGPFASGGDAIIHHSWTRDGTYFITVKTKDVFGVEGSTTFLEVSMPTVYNTPMLRYLITLFERFPHAFPILRQLLGY